ncbi:hypothetical protein [Microbacterium gorillae]|nr:hypothetical protein [Microbacterium gorillae]
MFDERAPLAGLTFLGASDPSLDICGPDACFLPTAPATEPEV